MRRYGVALVILICLMFPLLLKLVTGKPSAELPQVRITANGTEIPIILGSYCWREECVDAENPLDLARSDQYNTVSLPQDTYLEMTFEAAPQELIVSSWAGDRMFSNDVIMGTKTLHFPAPTALGIHPMAITATWPHGHASYYFQIETCGLEASERQ